MNKFRKLLSDTKFYSDYGTYNYGLGRYEDWNESVEKVMNMHRTKFKDKLTPELEKLITEAELAYKDKLVLGSQRALQFAGESLLKHEAKMYNCLSSYADRPKFFEDYFYYLLCGCGVGFSVQNRHISKLPEITKRTRRTRTFTPEDSIEGWADTVAVLLSSYFVDGGTRPEYKGVTVHFDLSKIRKKGSYITGGFKAPGPEPLRKALQHIEDLIESYISDKEVPVQMNSVTIYDICMHIADAVISGGVRRSATICLFDYDDEDMMKAKTFSNFNISEGINPQRARSNNSAVLVRNEVTRDQFDRIYSNIKDFGEPAFVFTEDPDITYNPCVEIGKYPQTEDGRSGFQGCNLTEINGGQCDTEEKFYQACRVSAILGTLQAGYTNFTYVEDTNKEIFEREALLGCSITGMAMNPKILFNPEIQRKGAEIIKQVNKEVAELININQAARTTCIKPSGNSSVILGTTSGVHADHAKDYFRLMQINKESEVAKFIKKNNPEMIEESVWSSTKSDYVIYFPISNPEKVLTKDNYMDTDFLELVKLTQENWVKAGHNPDLCVNPKTMHNVSNTCTVSDWDSVADFIFENRHVFSGVSLLGDFGDKVFTQAPNTKVITSSDTLVNMYGDGIMFLSGLIVDGLRAFDNDLWKACNAVMNNIQFEENSDNALKRDWIRRAKQFTDRYFDGNAQMLDHALKDVYLFHKWSSIQKKYIDINWAEFNYEPEFTDIDTMGAVACHGNNCEIRTL